MHSDWNIWALNGGYFLGGPAPTGAVIPEGHRPATIWVQYQSVARFAPSRVARRCRFLICQPGFGAAEDLAP